MMNRNKLYQIIITNLKKHGARKIAVFGSYARNEERKGSDIDILVDFLRKKSLLELVRMERELSEATGVKVDLLTEKSISPLLIRNVKRGMRLLYK